MKKSYLVLGIIALLLIVGFFVFGITSPDEDIERAGISGNVVSLGFENAVKKEIDMEKSSLEFEGYGPGKSHLGTFNEWEGYLFVEDGKIVGIEGLIYAESLESDGERLEGHLKSEDFFYVQEYPEIKFVTKSIENDILTGSLTLRGVTKEISFPVEIEDKQVQTEFVFDSSEFGFTHKAANPEVRIAFNFSS